MRACSRVVSVQCPLALPWKCPAELPILRFTGWLAAEGAEAEHHWSNAGVPPWLQGSCRQVASLFEASPYLFPPSLRHYWAPKISLAFRNLSLVKIISLCGLTDSVVQKNVSVRRWVFLTGVIAYCLPQAKMAPIRARIDLAGYWNLSEVSGHTYRNATVDHNELPHS